MLKFNKLTSIFKSDRKKMWNARDELKYKVTSDLQTPTLAKYTEWNLLILPRNKKFPNVFDIKVKTKKSQLVN